MALATLTPRGLRNRVILIFQMEKFNQSNLGGNLMLEKSCDAMKTNRVQRQIENAPNIYSQIKDLPKVVKPNTRVRL